MTLLESFLKLKKDKHEFCPRTLSMYGAVELNKSGEDSWLRSEQLGKKYWFGVCDCSETIDLSWVGDVFNLTEEEKFLLSNHTLYPNLAKFLKSTGVITLHCGPDITEEISKHET